MKKRVRLTKQGKILFISIILFTIILIFGIKAYKTYKYHQTYEYKFLQINYSLDEYNILSVLDNNKLDELLKKEYNENIPKLIQEKYFIYSNLDRYLAYLNNNSETPLTDTVALVNVNRDKEYYTDLQSTNIDEKEAMLVNKYHALSKDYQAPDIVSVSSTYGYTGQSLNKEAYEAFKKLANDAKKDGYTIIILSSYRNYEYQDKLWNERKNSSGTEKADAYAARAGSSEHETGYAIDVADYNHPVNFKDQESYQWMLNNSYKYGYILRYPEGKENITGYDFESWHYRYVGVDLATKIYNENITFDEYYEYYLNRG